MSEDIHKWKKVRPVFDELFDYPLPVALKKLSKHPELNEDEKSAVRKLLFGVHTKNTLIESSSQDLLASHMLKIRDLTGNDIGEYHLLSIVSQGGMSSIYLAERTDGSIQKQVAIKVLAPWQISDASQNLFNHEQTILSKLRHPNIVTMHHGGVTEEGIYYMVMDFLENSIPLDEYVKKNKLSTKGIIKLALTVARAISYAHANLVIHRDLKANNILIDDNGHVNVVDFGIASSEHHTHDKSLRVYTPEIASPEQILGNKITVTTDVFSLAATILSLLIKKKALPKIDPQEYDSEVDRAHINQVIKDSDLPHELCVIFQQALQVNPEERYVSMDHFAADLESWLQNKPISLLSDSRTYLIKKIISRNMAASIFAALTITVMIVSLFLISNYAQHSALAAQRADGAYNFLTEILSQADPFETGSADITIKTVLDANKDIPLASVNGDEYLKRDLHNKLSEIYGNLGFYKEQEEQLRITLELSNKLLHPGDLKLLETKTNLAIARMGILDLKTSIELSNEVLEDMHTYGNYDANTEMGALGNLLIAYGHRVGTDLYDRAAHNKTKDIILAKIDSPELTNGNVIINALSGLDRFYQRNGDYESAEAFAIRSIAATKDYFGENSLDYHYKMFDFAILKANSKKFNEAGVIIRELIKNVSDLDPYNSLVGRSWETYSTILFKTNQPILAIEALDKAEAIFKYNNDEDGLYYVLSKRAMYQFERYQFRQGINDQLEFIPMKINSIGAASSIVSTSLVNLTYMLFAIDEVDLANELGEHAVNLMLQDEVLWNNAKIYQSYFAILNWYHGNDERAQEIKNRLLELGQDESEIQYKLVDFLLSDAKTVNQLETVKSIRETDENSRLIRLFNLVKMAHFNSSESVDDAWIQKLCDYPTYYSRNKVIEFKVLYLSACVDQFTQRNLPIPEEFPSHLNSIEQTRQAITDRDRIEIADKVRAVIESLPTIGELVYPPEKSS